MICPECGGLRVTFEGPEEDETTHRVIHIFRCAECGFDGALDDFKED